MDLHEKGTHLVIIIEAVVDSHFLANEDTYTIFLDSVIAFANSHLMMSSRNGLTVIASGLLENSIVYPANLLDEIPKAEPHGQYELFANVSHTIGFKLKQLINKTKAQLANSALKSVTSLLSGALGTALVRINKFNTNYKASRIAIITCNSDPNSFASSNINFMNSFFTAQKMNVAVDVCVAGSVSNSDIPEDTQFSTSVLEQAASLTSGSFLRVTNIAALLEYLLWCFLPDIDMREKMVLPQKRKISYQATCFCHRNLIEIGFVCSVCLSIFCSFSPICSTCNTIFKLGPLPTSKSKKKLKTK